MTAALKFSAVAMYGLGGLCALGFLSALMTEDWELMGTSIAAVFMCVSYGILLQAFGQGLYELQEQSRCLRALCRRWEANQYKDPIT